MGSLLERKLIVVAGKGGVGKTTIAQALGLLAARQGRRTIVVELGHRQGAPEDPDRPGEQPGLEHQLSERLSVLSIDPDRVLADWLRTLGGRFSARVLLSSSTFQYFVAAAPGAREILSMVKVWELTEGGSEDERRRGRGGSHDLVILDAPATGHALALLSSPRTFAALARMGPIAAQSRQVRELLEDPARSGYLAVAHGTEMAVAETLQLREGLRTELGRELDAVVVNSALPRRFDERELTRIAALGADGDDAVARSAAVAARAVHERARLQNNQIARLRRQDLKVLRIPFVFEARLDPAAIERIADLLERGL